MKYSTDPVPRGKPALLEMQWFFPWSFPVAPLYPERQRYTVYWYHQEGERVDEGKGIFAEDLGFGREFISLSFTVEA
jgi:hypothetical protein